MECASEETGIRYFIINMRPICPDVIRLAVRVHNGRPDVLCEYIDTSVKAACEKAQIYDDYSLRLPEQVAQ